MPGKHQKAKRRNLPPCPDPEHYVLVPSKYGWYWRLKRGTLKKAVLNKSFSKNESVMGIVSPATSRVTGKLEPFTRGLATGNLHSVLCGKFMQTYKREGLLNFSLLKGFDFQEAHRLDKLLTGSFTIKRNKRFIEINIPVDKSIVKQHNRLVSDFYFEGLLLYGNALKERLLKLEADSSLPYSFNDILPGICTLRLPLPVKQQPWMLLLKVSCLEGNEPAVHPKHYGMKVIETGA